MPDLKALDFVAMSDLNEIGLAVISHSSVPKQISSSSHATPKHFGSSIHVRLMVLGCGTCVIKVLFIF